MTIIYILIVLNLCVNSYLMGRVHEDSLLFDPKDWKQWMAHLFVLCFGFTFFGVSVLWDKVFIDALHLDFYWNWFVKRDRAFSYVDYEELRKEVDKLRDNPDAFKKRHMIWLFDRWIRKEGFQYGLTYYSGELDKEGRQYSFSVKDSEEAEEFINWQMELHSTPSKDFELIHKKKAYLMRGCWVQNVNLDYSGATGRYQSIQVTIQYTDLLKKV